MAVAAVADLNQYLDLRHSDRDVAIPALMFDLDDITAKTCDQLRHAGQIAREIADLNAKADQPAGPDQSAHQNRRQQTRVDVSA